MLFITYSLLNTKGKGGSRLDQIVAWLQKRGDDKALIVFDECHKCKNLLATSGSPSTATARTAVELQARLPNARVVYASATGASTALNLAYMTRLGEFGFPSYRELLNTLDGAGLGSLELFSMGLKATGAYLCRTARLFGSNRVIASLLTHAIISSLCLCPAVVRGRRV